MRSLLIDSILCIDQSLGPTFDPHHANAALMTSFTQLYLAPSIHVMETLQRAMR